MKKLILVLACVGFMVSTIFAQTGTTNSAPAKAAASTTASTSTAKATKASAKYYCPKCMASSDKPGNCSMCHVAMVKEGMYYCPGCGATSTKAGKCTKCNMDMKKMTASASSTTTK